MIVTPTVRAVWPRIKAHLAAAHLRFLIRSHERDVKFRVAELNRLPLELDGINSHIAELRVQLAITERNT